MNTTEGNKLIAKFMLRQKPSNNFCVSMRDKEGFDICINQKTEYYPNNKLKFHSSWDWLMPVIEKIGETIPYDSELTIYESISIFSPIKDVWEAVIEFIQWHNQQQK